MQPQTQSQIHTGSLKTGKDTVYTCTHIYIQVHVNSAHGARTKFQVFVKESMNTVGYKIKVLFPACIDILFCFLLVFDDFDQPLHVAVVIKNQI